MTDNNLSITGPPRQEDFRHRIENILFLINRYNNIRDMEEFEEEIEENNELPLNLYFID